jgi:hypothetical protein
MKPDTDQSKAPESKPESKPEGWSLFVWGYALAWFVLNDRLKLLAHRILDPVKTKTPLDLAPQIATRA